MSYYVHFNSQIEYFRKALSSYQFAIKHINIPFADLLYNKATLHHYLQDYLDAIIEFKKAEKLDITLQANLKIEECEQVLNRIKKDFFDRFFSKSFLKETCKELKLYISKRENSLKNAISKYKTKNNEIKEWNLINIFAIKEKLNKRIFLIFKPIKWIQFNNSISKMLLLIDPEEQYVVLSVFNYPSNFESKITLKKTIIGVIEPFFKFIQTEEKGEREFIPTVQIFNYNDLIIDNSKLKK